MLGSISTMNSYYSMYGYGFSYGSRMAVRGIQKQSLQNTDPAAVLQKTAAPSNISRTGSTAAPEVRPAVFSGGRLYLTAPGANGQVENGASAFNPMQTDPAELAVRMRIQYPDQTAAPSNAAQDPVSGTSERFPESLGKESVSESERSKMIGEEEKCETCERRKYQDGSDDMGVSFQTPTHIAPEAAASAVRGHEQEHVVREQAKAEREDRRVVSQNVTLHTNICPECGKPYVSGGTTQTVTVSDSKQQTAETPEMGRSGQAAPERRPFFAVA